LRLETVNAALLYQKTRPREAPAVSMPRPLVDRFALVHDANRVHLSAIVDMKDSATVRRPFMTPRAEFPMQKKRTRMHNQRISIFVNLPLSKLDSVALQSRLDSIGTLKPE
jgi:hypothetical protein